MELTPLEEGGPVVGICCGLTISNPLFSSTHPTQQSKKFFQLLFRVRKIHFQFGDSFGLGT
jgi:hypothetical protein